MRIYNTLTRRKEEFVPITPGKNGIYVCGPTVYDFIHIGNARPMIVFDTCGEDLIFPHHENEIAQSETANEAEFARYWMHNAFLKINGDKMSKSLGNFFTVRDICKQYDPQVIRFFMLSAQYRTPLNFSKDLVEDAAKGLDRILNGAEKLAGIIAKDNRKPVSDKEKELLETELPKYIEKFDNAMDDDLNTADAVSAIFEFIRFANANTDEYSSSDFAKALYDTLFEFSDTVLGIRLERKEEEMDSEFAAKIEKLIAERTASKKEKNFALADEIRAKLLDMGIVIEDTREGVKWKKA